MKPQELRIGNWVLMDNEPTRVESISDNAINLFSDWEFYFKPIPLTPEILDKAGFRKINYYEGNAFGLEISDSHELVCNERMFWLACDDSFYNEPLDHIKYLHQLQNLYFALTGEELNIQL
jgi:hypothetical protein